MPDPCCPGSHSSAHHPENMGASNQSSAGVRSSAGSQKNTAVLEAAAKGGTCISTAHVSVPLAHSC